MKLESTDYVGFVGILNSIPNLELGPLIAMEANALQFTYAEIVRRPKAASLPPPRAMTGDRTLLLSGNMGRKELKDLIRRYVLVN